MTLLFGKSFQRFLYFFSDFLPVQAALGIAVVGRSGQGLFKRRPIRMHFRIGLVGNLFLQGLTLSKMIQADVGRDPVNPGVKTGLESETAERSIGLEKRLLENFSRVLAIPQHVER